MTLKSKLQLYEQLPTTSRPLNGKPDGQLKPNLNENTDKTTDSPHKSGEGGQSTHRSYGKKNEYQRVVIKKRSDPLVKREKMKSNINYLERKIKPLLQPSSTSPVLSPSQGLPTTSLHP